MSNTVDNKWIQDNYSGMDCYLEGLVEGQDWEFGTFLLPDSTPLDPGDPQTQTINSLLLKFKEVATCYRRLAEQTLEREFVDAPGIRAYYYDQILSRITEHVALLTEMRHSRSKVTMNNWSLINQIIRAIATRMKPTPMLIPIISSAFEYIHFNYVQCIGVIGIPLHVWANPSWNLSILWHEVAGYAASCAQCNGDLLKWATDLQQRLIAQDGLWAYYMDRFEQSALEKVQVKMRVYNDHCSVDEGSWFRWYFKNYEPQDIQEFQDLPNCRVGVDYSWQTNWFRQFYEDMFGLQALELKMLETLTHVLMSRYKTPLLGDLNHPPADLRLQVGIEFLKLLYKDNQSAIECLNTLVDSLKQQYTELSMLTMDEHRVQTKFMATAQIVANTYISTIMSTEGSSWPLLSEEEKAAVEVVRGVLDKETFAERLQLVEAKQKGELKNLSTDGHSEALPQSTCIWELAGVPTTGTEEQCGVDFSRGIDLATLLKIEIAHVDATGPGIGTLPGPGL